MSLVRATIVLAAGLACSAAAPHPASAARGDWRWPVGAPVVVLRAFEPPAGPYGPGHRGVDLALAAGATVRAARAGTVVVAGAVAGRPVVVVAHGPARTLDELRTTYEPVHADVRVGERVGAGERIGRLAGGDWHCSTGCLHWGLRRGDTYLDPTGPLDAPVRLLPVGPPLLVPRAAERGSTRPAPPTPTPAPTDQADAPISGPTRKPALVGGAGAATIAALLGLRARRKAAAVGRFQRR